MGVGEVSHYSVLVIAPPKTADIDAYVAQALSPYSDHNEKPHDCGWAKDNSAGCDFCWKNSKWDWYVVGGRWAGLLGAYDPTKDPRNYEVCFVCGGTGTRAGSTYGPEAGWARTPSAAGHPVIGSGCNGCHGTGWDLRHPPEWVVPPDGNVRQVAEIPENVTTYGVVLPDGTLVERRISAKYDQMPEAQWRVEWGRTVARYAPDHLGIVVDIHS